MIMNKYDSNCFSLNSELIKKELDEGIPVFLNVYHLTPANYVIQLIGFGFFHTTVEVKDTEYSFGATQTNISGIFYNKVGEGPKGITLKEKKYLGNTIYNERTIHSLLQLYLPYWQGNSYDPFMKNCNHFTKFFATKLLKSQRLNYPQYVNRIISYGIWLNAFYSPIKRLYGTLACQPTDYAIISNSIDHENINININNDNYDVDTADVQICIGQSENEDTQRNMIEYKQSSNTNIFPENEDEFFNQCFTNNQFLNQYKDDKGNSSFFNYLAIADDLFIKNQIDKAIEIYQHLLSTIDSEGYQELKDFKSNFPLKKYILSQQLLNSNMIISKENETSEILALVKIKILHCIQYYYYKTKQYQKQDCINNKIISINKRDYYAMFASAYVKYKENKYPECFQLLHSSLLDCSNEEYKNYLKHFLSIIDKLELS